MNNNHHTVTTTSSSVPPLIHQQTFYTDKSDKLQADELAKSKAAAEAAKEAAEAEVTDVPVEAQVPVEENEEPEPEIDIVISNVVSAFSVRCQLALKDIALNGANVEYKRENGMVTMKLRKPYTTASIWSSGKITCTGATSEDEVRSRLISHRLSFRLNFCLFTIFPLRRHGRPLAAMHDACKSSTFVFAFKTIAS